jgi:peptide/nickel transport system substrate-binding protein
MARRIRWQILIASLSSLLVVVLLSGLALSSATVSRPQSGGRYTEAVPGRPQQVIPLLSAPQDDPAGQDLAALVFDGLTRIGVDGLPEAALADHWERDASGEVYTFRLRQDVRWHDGEPFTADDVVFTLHTLQQSPLVGDPALANVWQNVLVDRLDDYTVRCTLNAPYAPLLSKARFPILPAHLLADTAVEAWDTLPFAQKPVGTGPYRIVTLDTNRAELQANPDYFLGTPFIQHIELRFFESPQMALSALELGDVQAFGFETTPDLERVALPDSFRKVRIPLDEYTVLSFNMRNDPLDTVQFRQALAKGLNKKTLIRETLGDTVMPLDTPILRGWWAHTRKVSWYDYNQKDAATALDDQGYSLSDEGQRMHQGEPLVLPLLTGRNPAHLAVAQEITRQWGNLGITVQIEEVDSSTLRQRLQQHQFVLALHSWARVGDDPDVFALWHSSQADGGLNYAGLRDKQIDTALLQARAEPELAARSEFYAEFQKRWVTLAPAITLYQPNYTFAVSNQVGGLDFEQLEDTSNLLLIGREDRYRNVRRWFVSSSREIEGTLR